MSGKGLRWRFWGSRHDQGTTRRQYEWRNRNGEGNNRSVLGRLARTERKFRKHRSIGKENGDGQMMVWGELRKDWMATNRRGGDWEEAHCRTSRILIKCWCYYMAYTDGHQQNFLWWPKCSLHGPSHNRELPVASQHLKHGRCVKGKSTETIRGWGVAPKSSHQPTVTACYLSVTLLDG